MSEHLPVEFEEIREPIMKGDCGVLYFAGQTAFYISKDKFVLLGEKRIHELIEECYGKENLDRYGTGAFGEYKNSFRIDLSEWPLSERLGTRSMLEQEVRDGLRKPDSILSKPDKTKIDDKPKTDETIVGDRRANLLVNLIKLEIEKMTGNPDAKDDMKI